MTRQEKINKIAEHYGYDRQCKQLIEEMGELTHAICKVWRENKDKDLEEINYCDMPPRLFCAVQAMLGEIADVKIMIEQLEHLLNMRNEVEHIAGQKLDRQLKRMKEEKDGRKA